LEIPEAAPRPQKSGSDERFVVRVRGGGKRQPSKGGKRSSAHIVHDQSSGPAPDAFVPAKLGPLAAHFELAHQQT
jgi:hypothetical protein